MAKRQRPTPGKRRSKMQSVSRRRPAPWEPLDQLDVKRRSFDQRGESIVVKAAPTPISAPPPARAEGPRPKAARDCAVAVLVRRRVKLADLIRTVGLKPSENVMRSFLRILANGKKLLEDERTLPREALPVAGFDKSRYQGDAVALVSVVIPLLGALPGVPPLSEPKVRAQLLGLLAPRRTLT